MKVALVCIAKNEDRYIDEWISYHKKIGFDDIFIYENDWRLNKKYDNVHTIPFDGSYQQINAYNHFIKNHNDYEWIAFFDVDEFIVLKKHSNIKEFIKQYSYYPAIAINWVFFGDNGITHDNKEEGVIKRFTKRQKGVNLHVKCIVKYFNGLLMHVHSPLNVVWCDTNYNLEWGAYNNIGDDNIAQLNHYWSKTFDEFKQKVDKGQADNIPKRDYSDHDHGNLNEIDDYIALNFLYGP